MKLHPVAIAIAAVFGLWLLTRKTTTTSATAATIPGFVPQTAPAATAATGIGKGTVLVYAPVTTRAPDSGAVSTPAPAPAPAAADPFVIGGTVSTPGTADPFVIGGTVRR